MRSVGPSLMMQLHLKVCRPYARPNCRLASLWRSVITLELKAEAELVELWAGAGRGRRGRREDAMCWA
jgi:hypothetical protein